MERTTPHERIWLMRGSALLFVVSLFTLMFLLTSCQRDELSAPSSGAQVDDHGGDNGGHGSDDPPGDDNGGGQ